MRYFRLRSTLWRCSRVQGFKTMAERRTRAGRMNSLHKPAMIRSVARRSGARFAPAIEDQQLVSDQHGFGDNGTEPTRPCHSGQGDDQMNEYDNEVAHPGNGIKTSKTPHSGQIWQFVIDTFSSRPLGVVLDGFIRHIAAGAEPQSGRRRRTRLLSRWPPSASR